MGTKNGKSKRKNSSEKRSDSPVINLHPDTKRSIWALAFFGMGVILTLAGTGHAGPMGDFLHRALQALVGLGYFALPVILFILTGVFLLSERRSLLLTTSLGSALLILSILGSIHVFRPAGGGWLGYVFGSLVMPFGTVAAGIVNGILFVIALLVTLNTPIRLKREKLEEEPEEDEEEVLVTGARAEDEDAVKPKESPKPGKMSEEESEEGEEIEIAIPHAGPPKQKKTALQTFKNYVPPPADLLKSSTEKPTTGDLRANANIIKRTLESFGIMVEMGEINIGPKVTRYTLKPAEGVKLTRITALSQDLALALAAHPIRIEAPIPGKSLVGIEVPNKAAALVRLGSLMAYPEFMSSGPLGFILGRDVTGEPIFGNIEKMPHLLIAGATGSGKSVTIHSLILSLLYKNSPATLKLILIDPKRVELSIYENLPHLVSPVITESKKSVGVFRWAVSEMDRRYELLQAGGSRDVKSYNAGPGKDDPLPYLAIIVDELADLMTSYGREVEGSIVRLAQMARATGIHLILATQRPSVEVITGLIKANITSRIALQVASQIDSRTILDTGGAEKLLGGGDMLFISSNLSKPMRIQSSYVTEEEIHGVADFIRENNPLDFGGTEVLTFEQGGAPKEPKNLFDEYMNDGEDDDMYDEALEVVKEAGKASASLLQRRLKVGYARAARLLDIMEQKGIIGPGEGAKPREVFVEKNPEGGF